MKTILNLQVIADKYNEISSKEEIDVISDLEIDVKYYLEKTTNSIYDNLTHNCTQMEFLIDPKMNPKRKEAIIRELKKLGYKISELGIITCRAPNDEIFLADKIIIYGWAKTT